MKRIMLAGLALLTAGAATVLTGTPAQAVPGLSFQSVQSLSNGTDTKSVSVACPAGQKPLGGGFFVSGGSGGRISVTRLQALSPSNTFAVTARPRPTPARRATGSCTRTRCARRPRPG
jgi:hypothetical protein